MAVIDARDIRLLFDKRHPNIEFAAPAQGTHYFASAATTRRAN
jgi:hypothetical protein